MEQMDLQGRWALCRGGASERPSRYTEEITLPDSLSHAGIGERQPLRLRDSLTDPYAWEGCAWFRREVELPASWAGLELQLFLERTRMTAVYWDGAEAGRGDSLCTPHRFRLPPSAPGRHVLEIAVSNTGYPTKGGHMTSPDTQTNWTGILGRILLQALPRQRVEQLQVLSATRADQVCFSLEATVPGPLRCQVDDEPPVTMEIPAGRSELSLRPAAPLALWDEFSPALHVLTVFFGGETVSVSFGIRHLEARGRKLLINGRELFLRGKHQGLVFPDTGYAPMTVEAWRENLLIAKSYGINHYRCHTCCPPEAAFIAADQLGVYLEPELPFWGTVEEAETEENRYLTEEGFRILREYGNHPSFVFFSLGNELWGSERRMEEMLREYRRADDRHLYTDGSNNFQFTPKILSGADFLCGVRLSAHRLYRGSYAMCDAPLGFLQTEAPNTLHTYDRAITVPENRAPASGGTVQIQFGTEAREVGADGTGPEPLPELPVISHEVGQYDMYPDYREIDRYTGVLQPENLRLWREKAAEKGLLPWADAFFRASGSLAVDCYRLEVEAALKSRELSGFQLLDLQDYPGQGGALVGVLNAFMESKGLIAPERWRAFCDDQVILAALPGFVLRSGEPLRADILLFRTDPAFAGTDADIEITCGDRVLHRSTLPIRREGRVESLGTLCWTPDPVEAPEICWLTLRVRGTGVSNRYRLTVYPADRVEITERFLRRGEEQVWIARSLPEAERLRAAGSPVLLIPGSEGCLPGEYCTDFWCYPMFRAISEQMGKPVPVGTLGCLIDADHPALRDFPTESYSVPEWYRLITHSHCDNLDGTDIEPIVWVIDHPSRAQRLGLLYLRPTAHGDLLVCTSRLWEIADAPEVQAFARSLMRWLLAGMPPRR